MERTVELDIRSLLMLLWKNLRWIIISVLVGAIVFFAVAQFILPPKYTSSVSLYVNNNTEQGTTQNGLNINDINASQKLVNTYVVILQDDKVLEEVADKLMDQYTEAELESYIGLSTINGRKTVSPGALRSVLTMGAVNDTEVLRIQATTKDAMFSAEICNLLAETAPDVLQRVIKAGSVEIIGEAEPVFSPSSPNVRNYVLIGIALGLVVSIGAILIRFLLDNTIKGEEDIKAVLDIPVLGEIPDLNQPAGRSGYGKGGYGYGE